jgi:hypothetical protein
MVDLFHAISSCGDLIEYWDVARRDGGIVLRAKSRARFPTEDAATGIADSIVGRVTLPGRRAQVVSAVAQTDGAAGWHALVEVVIA